MYLVFSVRSQRKYSSYALSTILSVLYSDAQWKNNLVIPRYVSNFLKGKEIQWHDRGNLTEKNYQWLLRKIIFPLQKYYKIKIKIKINKYINYVIKYYYKNWHKCFSSWDIGMLRQKYVFTELQIIWKRQF